MRSWANCPKLPLESSSSSAFPWQPARKVSQSEPPREGSVLMTFLMLATTSSSPPTNEKHARQEISPPRRSASSICRSIGSALVRGLLFITGHPHPLRQRILLRGPPATLRPSLSRSTRGRECYERL